MISIYSIVRMDHLGWDPNAIYTIDMRSFILPEILERYTEQVIPANLNNHPTT